MNQWLKNLLIFIPAVFSAAAWNAQLLFDLGTAFLGCSFMASAVYIHNDIKDKELDAQHPEKQKRSIASGVISITEARILQLGLLLIGTLLLFFTHWFLALLGASYVVINLLYTEFLKQVPLVDLVPILSGYLIRLLIGETVAKAPLSSWVLLLVGFLALYLVLMKRWGDVLIYKNTGIVHRKTVPFYAMLNLKLVTLILIHIITLVFAAYIHIVFVHYPTSFSYLPYLTIPLTYAAIFSYHLKAQQQVQKDPISILLRNPWSLILVGTSFAILVLTLYPML